MKSEPPIILFDGVCNLCNASVQFVIERDPMAVFRFAALQSDFGQAILAKNAVNTEGGGTVILVENGQVYDRSTAALRVAKRLSGGIKLLAVFLIVPKPIRDFFYKIIARNRYRWFGKQETCWLPAKELKARFID
ncbi:MAG: thiol-disulfide oxidoreductase DCC family protein [Saprospiraceae bacterium]|nr:thiol-disulfide oxidoreductase DCC family protein [Saprospiraceae bacterium]